MCAEGFADYHLLGSYKSLVVNEMAEGSYVAS